MGYSGLIVQDIEDALQDLLRRKRVAIAAFGYWFKRRRWHLDGYWFRLSLAPLWCEVSAFVGALLWHQRGFGIN